MLVGSNGGGGESGGGGSTGGGGYYNEDDQDDEIVDNDVLDSSDFLYQTTPTGCRTTCKQMQENAGYSSSDSQFIPMTYNSNDVAYAPHERFLEGKNYIDNQLAMGRAVIVGVDYKGESHITGNLDGASDHFVLIVGKYAGYGSDYYHYFDPRTSNVAKGTRSENVLFIENGFLHGIFVDSYPNKIYDYVVTRVNYNVDL